MSHPYQPPYTITPAILNLVAKISETVGHLSALTDTAKALRLRRINRIRTIRGSLAIEDNTLSEEQITAILDGKRVIAPPPKSHHKSPPKSSDCWKCWKARRPARNFSAPSA